MGDLHPQKIKCRATARTTGNRCERWAVKGALVCRLHGAGGDPDDPKARGAHKAKERIQDAEAELRAKLFEMHQAALDAVQSVLEDPNAKPADRLKAADAVLNRFVAQKAETKVKVDSTEERDLDEEIAAALELDATEVS